MSYKQFFKRTKNTVTFVGDKLEILIPMRYEPLGVLDIGEYVVTLGIFDMVVNGSTKVGYLLPAKIQIEPHTIETIVKDGDRYAKLTLLNGNVFITNTQVVRDEHLAYTVFYELIYGGKTPDFITYENHAFMFDYVTEVTGIRFPTDHSVFEMITSMLHRDPKDLSKLWRLTAMKGDPKTLPLRLVSHAALSTTGKIIGAYDEDGIDAALVNASEVPSEIENLLRA